MKRDVDWKTYTGQLSPIPSDVGIQVAWCNEQSLFAGKVDGLAIAVIAGKLQISGTDLDKVKAKAWQIAKATERVNASHVVNRAHILNFAKEL